MKIIQSGFFFLSLSTILVATQYEANWESIDSRPTPEWWSDAKFGIFIHWGPYAVPAYTKVGQYSEWYWQDLRNPGRKGHEAVTTFHNDHYGPGFTYADFIPQFTAELFDPQEWAQLFEDSGAKYVVLTSKHHDGYCLWPSAEADQSWGRPWNSVDTGPGRDLLGELTDAVRETPLKMGIYYSLYEWYNPLYQADVDLFVDQHMIPQFKDVVSRYAPSVIFSDGEWDHPAETWRSEELLAWLYNEAPSKDHIVINDRWGKGTRHNHGGYFTTEYTSGLSTTDKPWEESRGMGFSYGYNRAENIHDYNSAQELIFMFVDIVSRGGNFLLNVGPTADGRIPTIMQERLMEIGEWLNVNGEAIYDTTLWKESVQWTEGEIPKQERGDYNIEYDIMSLTLEPDEGFARKEMWFTRKESTVYAILTQFPDKKVRVRDVVVDSNGEITLLGFERPLKWSQVGNDLEVEMPSLNPSQFAGRYAWTLKISGIQD